jgi:hypothetical protein
MKTLKAALLALCIAASTGCATTRDAALVAGYASITADFISTEDALQRGCKETNPLYGNNPSDTELGLFMLANYGLLWAVSELLPDNKYSTWALWGYAGLRTSVAAYNYSLDC